MLYRQVVKYHKTYFVRFMIYNPGTNCLKRGGIYERAKGKGEDLDIKAYVEAVGLTLRLRNGSAIQILRVFISLYLTSSRIDPVIIKMVAPLYMISYCLTTLQATTPVVTLTQKQSR